MRRASHVAPIGGKGGGGRASARGSVIGTTQRRDLLAMQAELDKEIFDPSLGAPLSSFEGATIGLVGGKALQCWRLTRHGFPVPSAFVVPTYVYSMHTADADVAQLIDDVYTSDLSDPVQLEKAKSDLKTIREKIVSTPLNPEVIDNLTEWLLGLAPGSFVAVRSSGSAEDLASQSFAGQYDTYLYKIEKEDIINSIKLCWASMFKDHILDYAIRTDDYKPGSIATPKMGILIMKMVDSQASGVMFSRNLWGDRKETMIEAVLGQGEGLVSGDITPDRYVLDKYSTRLQYSDIAEHTQMYARANNQDGVEKITLDKPHEGPVLSTSNLTKLTNLSRAVEDFYNCPMDIEWALDKVRYFNLSYNCQLCFVWGHGATTKMHRGVPTQTSHLTVNSLVTACY